MSQDAIKAVVALEALKQTDIYSREVVHAVLSERYVEEKVEVRRLLDTVEDRDELLHRIALRMIRIYGLGVTDGRVREMVLQAKKEERE